MAEGGSQGAAVVQPQPAGAGSLFGAALGSYRVGKLLGEGGMGRVYLAEHVLIGRKAAIKVLSAEVAGHEEVVSRFFTEARSVNDIRHPNIVEVTDFGTHGNQPYIVMEYLEGETLEARLEREGALSPPTVARVAAQVASALGAAHERGMVHRDLKPANIFLRQHPDYPDFVKVLDFGIAKLLGPSQAKHRTEIGQVIGTPAYMSPEQCLGDVALDQRSDIYSLGVVLYQMLAGRPPFPGESIGRLLMAHLQETPPSLLALNPRLPAGVCAVVERAMAKRPESRFASMRDLKEALLAAVASAIPSAPLDVPGSGAIRIAPVVAPAAARPATPGFATTIAPAPTPGGQEAALKAKLIDIVQARIANGTVELPRLSDRVRECLQVTSNPGFSFAKAASVIAQDSRLRAAMFTLSSSAEGAARAAATSLEQAIGRLGAQGVRLGIVEIATRDVLDVRDERIAQAFRKPMQHAVAVATLTQRLVQLHPDKNERLAEQESTEAYLVGLLHDVGKPLVAALLLEVEKQLATVRGRRWLLEPLLVAIVEATHQPVSAALVRRWGLPEAVAAAIEAPRKTGGGRLVDPLLLAEGLAAQEGFYLRREDQANALDVIAAGRAHLRLDDKAMGRVVQGVRDRVLRRA